jgi:hypothetical protein
VTNIAELVTAVKRHAERAALLQVRLAMEGAAKSGMAAADALLSDLS